MSGKKRKQQFGIGRKLRPARLLKGGLEEDLRPPFDTAKVDAVGSLQSTAGSKSILCGGRLSFPGCCSKENENEGGAHDSARRDRFWIAIKHCAGLDC